jgi:catechol 2,3-dioxygenase-like lactoylglutathione lyase family enzyme
MNGSLVHHVGYLAEDVESASHQLCSQLGVEVTRRFERPKYSLFGVYLGMGPGNIEVFSFTDSSLVMPRLNGRLLMLDHIAFEVPDIRVAAAQMSDRGVPFTSPDGRQEIQEPINLG